MIRIGTVLLLLLVSCKSAQVTEKHYKLDSTIIRYEPLIIEVPGSEVIQEIPPTFYDSLVLLLSSRPVEQRIIYRTDPTLQTRLSFFLDSLGNLQTKCETIEKSYQDSIQSILRIIKEIDHRSVVREPGLLEKAKTFVNNFSMIIMIVAIGITIFILKK